VSDEMSDEMSDDVRDAVEHGWRQLARIDAALERGEIDEAGWHAAVLEVIEPLYLGASTPQGQSGRSGDAEEWEQARRMVLDGVDRDGSFLDVGCANGLLMECVHRWAAEDGRTLEPYGVEISGRLADLARRRCPRWADRIWAANVLDWRPPRRFDFVRTGLEYVPGRRRADLVQHLLDHVVEPDGRLLIGTTNEPTDRPGLADALRGWGFEVTGTAVRPHTHEAVQRTVHWLDGERREPRQ
jgi:SAM-dependent methyltransferase